MKVTKLNRFLFPAVALAAAVVLTGCEGTGGPTEQGAAVMCEEFIKKKLKAPGTAKFAGVSETKIETLSDVKPWKYKVRAWVESENSFGGTVHYSYVCKISTKDDNETDRLWTLDDLKFTERK